MTSRVVQPLQVDETQLRMEHYELMTIVRSNGRNSLEELEEAQRKPYFNILLNYKCNPFSQREDIVADYKDKTLFDAALVSQNLEVLKFLNNNNFDFKRAEEISHYSNNVKLYDIKAAKKEFFSYLNDLGYTLDLNASYVNSTAKYIMSVIDDPEDAEYFLSLGLPIEESLLAYLKNNEYPRKKVVQVFLDKHVDVNYLGEFYGPFVHYAAVNDLDDIAELLVENGAIVDLKRADENDTPLMIAVSDCLYDGIRILLELGADTRVKNKLGDNLLFMAIFDRDGYAERLTSVGRPLVPKYANDQGKIIEMLELLAEHGVDVHETTKEGWNLTQYASRYNLKEVSECTEDLMQRYASSVVHEEAGDNHKELDIVSSPSAATLSPFDEVKKFKELLDMGIIDESEFNKKKKELLGL